jgi:hypothetical protein
MDMRFDPKRLGLVVGALALLFVSAIPARGLEDQGFTLTDSHPHQRKDFDPIPAQNPGGTLADPTLDDCKQLPSDVAVKIGLKLQNDVSAKETFSVSWGSPGNDVDVYMFDDDGNLVSKSASSSNPEIMKLGGLPSGTYYICVVNYSGANTGFTIDGKVDFLKLYHYSPPPPTPAPSTPTPTPAATTPPPSGSPLATIAPEVVLTPGPNGPSKVRDLDAVSGSRQAAARKTGHSGLSIALGAATILVAGSAAGLVIVRIRRDL